MHTFQHSLCQSAHSLLSHCFTSVFITNPTRRLLGYKLGHSFSFLVSPCRQNVKKCRNPFLLHSSSCSCCPPFYFVPSTLSFFAFLCFALTYSFTSYLVSSSDKLPPALLISTLPAVLQWSPSSYSFPLIYFVLLPLTLLSYLQLSFRLYSSTDIFYPAGLFFSFWLLFLPSPSSPIPIHVPWIFLLFPSTNLLLPASFSVVHWSPSYCLLLSSSPLLSSFTLLSPGLLLCSLSSCNTSCLCFPSHYSPSYNPS